MAEGSVKIPVTLNTNPAKAALDALKHDFGSMQSEVHNSFGGVVHGVTNDLRAQLNTVVWAMSKRIIQANGSQGIIDPITVRMNAQERTVASLGQAAQYMDPKAIRAIFNVYKAQEERELKGRRAVEDATANSVLTKTEFAALTVALTALNKTMASLINTYNSISSSPSR